MRGKIKQHILFFSFLLGLCLTFSSLKAQTDTEFWFVVPEVTISHQSPGGVPASFRLSTGLLPATVTISMPADRYDPGTNPTGFKDIVINMAANSFHVEWVSCWIVTPCVTPPPPPPLIGGYAPGFAATDLNPTRMENKNLNPSGINNFGIQITSTNPITAYYEVSRDNNKDIWALKGGNGLGTEFFTPFQTNGDNQNVPPIQPYSAIDIVATEDFTQVTFELPSGIAASFGLPYTNIAAGGIHTINLMQGQTFSLFPLGKSRSKLLRLAGTKITSTNPIAVSTKDDSFLHTGGGCYDLAGDQLIPTNIIGKEYAVIRTDLYQLVAPSTNRHDHIYILATQNATQVTVYKTDGTVEGVYNLNAGQQQYVRIPFPEVYYRIVATKPVYVWHIGGFGCEQGGAILPPIDICTGTTQVAFARTSTETFYVIMLVRKGAENGFIFDGAPSALFPAASFVPMPSSDWSVARFGPFTTAQISAATSHFMENTEDIFHLGIVNGGSSSGCFYGYFSDYNELKVEAVVAGTQSNKLQTCYGNSVQLYVEGGTDYLWSPDSTLSDPTSQLPMATPHVNAKYQVIVSGACDMTDTAFIDVVVFPPLSASFITDKVEGCAPFTVTFEDKSMGIAYWQYDFGDGSAYLKYDTNPATPDIDPPNPFTFTHTFQNNTDTAIVYKVVLLAKNAEKCSDVYEKFITVYPSINASYSQDVIQGCNPLAVTFINASSNNTADSYAWEFGDAFNAVTSNPVGTLNHTFNNPVPRDTTYNVRMVATSPFSCRDTATSSVTVYSYFDAGFTVNVTAGCSPLTVNIHNTSVGDTARYRWTLDGVVFKTTGLDTTLILSNNALNTFKDFIIELQVFNQGDRCNKTVAKTVRVYPRITADFTIPPPAAFCNLTNVTFTNATLPTTTNPGGVANVYNWEFGDGANSASPGPITHQYDNQTNIPRDYTVRLTARNQFGCESTITHTVRIYSQLYADFAVAPTMACSPVTANIDNNSRGGVTNTYLWDYGDATTSGTNLDHTHPYINNGLAPITRTINLTITNEGACTSTESHDVTIYPSVTASFTPVVVTGCNPLSVTFDNTSKTNATVYNWSFGDGGTSVEEEPSHTFTNLTGVDATYTVNLNVLTDFGCTASATAGTITVYPFIDAQFGIDTSSGCSPLDVMFSYTKHPGITQYRWDWDGGGTIDAITLPADPTKILHQYVNQTGVFQLQNPKLTVANHANCTDVMQLPVIIYPEVTAAFTKSAIAGCNPLTINFTNNSFYTGTPNPLVNANYYWDYGDGGSSVVKSPTHEFINDDANNNVVYSSLLQVISEYGCADSIIQNIEVYNRVESHFTFEHASNCTPFDVTFTPGAMGASVYNWDYDGALPPESFLNGNQFTRQFTNADPNNPAIYTIKLEVRNNEGCPSIQTRDLEVYPIVDAQFVPSTVLGCSDLNVNFVNNSKGGNMLYLWDFGNGQSASTNTKLDVSQLFTNRGSIDSIYTVKLKTINANGCRDSLSIDVTVHSKVEAGFVFAQQSQCTPFNLDLTNTSLNGNRFFWSTIYNGSTVTLNKDLFAYPIDNLTLNSILTETIKLVSRDTSTGCADSVSKQLTVYPKVKSGFDVNKIAGCNPLSVSFTNQSSGLGTYLWEFGDGGTSVAPGPITRSYSHPYTDTVKTYTAKLTATNSFGCKSDKDTLLTVYPLVKADFQWDKYEGCTPLTIILNNSSASLLYKYRWDFGDGSSRTNVEQPTSHTFTNSTNSPPIIQTPTITLRTSYVNDTTCIDSLKLPVKVFPKIYPKFGFTKFFGCTPLITDIKDSTVSFNSANQYRWNLGDGTFSTFVGDLHDLQYKNTSVINDITYSIKLIAHSVHQCADSTTRSLVVHPRPIASFEMKNESTHCSPFPIELNNHSIGPVKLFSIFNLNGKRIETEDRNAVIKDTLYNYTNEVQPYTISLKDSTEYGCLNSISQTVYAYPQVTARFDLDKSAGCSPLYVEFDGSPTANGYFYVWNFKDGTNSNLMSPNHRFVNITEKDKTFNVRLKSISAYDCEDSTIVPVTVFATPVANFSVSPPLKIFPDATFNFHNQSSPAANNWKYEWDFGDGFGSTLKEAGDHTYLQWGPKNNDFIYNARLIVTPLHAICADTTYNVLRLLPAAPIPFFTADRYKSCSPLEVHFYNASEYGSKFEWNFGDGSPISTDEDPIHTFTEPGYYNVKLTVFGDGGNSYYYQIFRVFQNPKASFAVYPNRVMLPDAEVHLYNLTQYGHRYEWELNNVVFSTDKDPVIKFDQLGEYQIGLTAFSHDTLGPCQNYVSVYPAVWVEGQGVIKFPNAFLPSKLGPNGGVYDEIDYKNEVFHPIHYGVSEYKLMVFNRWGEQIFQSDDVKIGWDGYFKDKLCDQGVYIWRAIGKYTNGRAFDQKGNLTLLR